MQGSRKVNMNVYQVIVQSSFRNGLGSDGDVRPWKCKSTSREVCTEIPANLNNGNDKVVKRLAWPQRNNII